MSDPNVLQLLGKIDGKLDQVIDAAREHRDDDKRRFSDVYDKLDAQSEEIAKAKGAKGVILALVGAGAAVIGGLVSFIAKLKGGV